MKTEPMLYSLIGGSLVGLAWLATAHAAALRFELIVSYGAVAGIVAIGALDYRIRQKKYFR